MSAVRPQENTSLSSEMKLLSLALANSIPLREHREIIAVLEELKAKLLKKQ